MQDIHCFIRKIWVAATPEEYVRQETLQLLVQHLGFPPSYIVVEKDFASMPHQLSNNKQRPERRADIICYTKQGEGLSPLLLIECKAVPLGSKELRQVIGYNHFLKAPFIALTNQSEKKLGWFDPLLLDYKFIDYFPTYSELINSLCY